MPDLNTAGLPPRPWARIDRLLAKNRKQSLQEMSVEELANLVDEMRTEVLAICANVDEQRERLRVRRFRIMSP